MENLVSKKQLTIYIARKSLTVFLVAILAFLAVTYTTKKITAIGKSTSQKKKVSILLQRRGQTISVLKADLEKYNWFQKSFVSAFPDAENVLPFVETLEALGKENSLEVSVKFDNPIPDPVSPQSFPVYKAAYTLTLTGNVANIQNFLSSQEKLPYFIKITSANIQSAPEDGWATKAIANIKAEIYVH